MADKRITELTNEKLVLGDGDYTIVDSNEGTYKFKLKRILDSIPEPDTTLSIAGRAADAAKTGEEIADVKSDLSDKANTDGTYDGMTVGSSRQLLSESYLLDEEPYLFRASGGDGSDRVEECIVGGSVVWNQLAQNGDFSSGTTGWDSTSGTLSATNNVLTSTRNTSSGQVQVFQYLNVKTNHVLFGCCAVRNRTSSTRRLTLRIGDASGLTDIYTSPNVWTTLTIIKTANANSLEYNIYGRSSSEWSSGDEFDIRNCICIDLTALFGTTIADYIYSLEQATAGAGVAWFRKYFPEDYYPYSAPTLRHVEGVSAKQIRDSDDNVTAIYPLDSSLTLRGIPKLTDGKMYFDGDKYNADGTVQRRYGIVDLGTLDWNYASGEWSAFYHNLTGRKSGKMNILCSKYVTAEVYNTSIDKICVGNEANAYIYIRDTSFNGDTAAFKTAMSGVYLLYELATPTEETAQPFQSPQRCFEGGTEEYVTTGIVPVGHESHYLENLRAKIEGLPKDFSTLIAPTEKEYKATRNYTVGSLLIVDNILYKVTSAIANGGTITPNTNVTATTLAAVIAAL